MQFDNQRLFNDILNRLDHLKKNHNSNDQENYSFKCTHHTDRHASAYIALNKDDEIIAGCRVCADYGLNVLLGELGVDIMEYRLKDELYHSIESLKEYIKKNNVGNVFKDDNDKWITDKDYKFEDAYFYEDDQGKLVLCKIKYRNSKGEKKFVQRAIVDNKIMSTKDKNPVECDKILYNLSGIKRAIEKKQYVYLVEGEKDADTLMKLGLCATTSSTGAGSWYKEYNALLSGAKVVLIRDFDDAGYNHVQVVKANLKSHVEMLRIINWLPGIDALNIKGADVTDWINAGHTKKELVDIAYNSLDILNLFDMQELTDFPNFGIYSFEFDDGNVKPVQVCNFLIDHVDLIDNRESEEEYFMLNMRIKNNRIIKKTGHVNVFNDVRSFRDFLGSSDLIFRGKVNDLINLKEWVFSYKKRKTLKGLDVGGIRKIEDEWLFVTHQGSYDKRMQKRNDILLQNDDHFGNLEEVEELTKEELAIVFNDLIGFAHPQVVYTVLGHIGAVLMNGKYEAKNIKLNHLAIFGESGAGKSTIAETVILPLMNFDEKIMLSDTTPFALMNLASTNITLPLVMEEYKPSSFHHRKNNQISNLLRNGYDRTSAWKGMKNQKVINYKVVRPFIVIGEEGFLNEETALKERSNVIYISREDKTKKTTAAVESLQKNVPILNKLGKVLIRAALAIDEEGFKEIREKAEKYADFKDRPKNTFVNTVHGLNIFYWVFKRFGMDLPDIEVAIKAIAENIKENVLQGGEETKTQVEMMLELIDEALSNGCINKYNMRVDFDKLEVYIHLPTIYPKLTKYVRDFNRDVPVLSKSDFVKQLKKSKYLKNQNVGPARLGDVNFDSVKKCYALDLIELEKLGLENIKLFEEIEGEFEQKQMDGFYK